MNALTQRYAPGGDLYEGFAAKYGANGAEKMFAAAQEAERTGDRSGIADALGALKYGAPLTESSLKIFGQQIYNEPLTAPLEQVSNVTEKTFATVFNFKNWGLWILIAAALGYLFFSRR